MAALAGTAVVASTTATGSSAGTMGYLAVGIKGVSGYLPRTANNSVMSLASTQCQMTLVAQVAMKPPHGRQGGTCVFLGQECGYYTTSTNPALWTLQKLKNFTRTGRAQLWPTLSGSLHSSHG